MTEIVDVSPEVRVDPAEYRRLLGYPRGAEMSERAQELAANAGDWYRRHGAPWIYARQVDRERVAGFTSQRLSSMLDQAEAQSAFLVAVSAGPEAEEHAHKLWLEEKPDEYFFLETFGSAVVEQLITLAGARLCAWADGERLAVLPHCSPGYSQWDVAEQTQLLNLIESRTELPGRLETLVSGALRPKKSQLAVFGITPQIDRVRQLSDLVPCQNCSLGNCQFRRTPYQRAPVEVKYSVNARALARWAAERLTLETCADGMVHARFLYEGTTCMNLGRTLVYQYDVLLARQEDGFRIRDQHCAPVAGDTGHAAMCEYQSDAAGLTAAIDKEKPLLGQPLASIFTWQRDFSPAGCYCDATSRAHKWGLVLETIHYALHQQNRNGN
jgi:hypothetical protein